MNQLQYRLYKSTLNSLPHKQRLAILNRIGRTNPLGIYKHKNSNTIVLAVHSAASSKPFYFMYWDNGQEIAKGHHLFTFNNKQQYRLIVNFETENVDFLSVK
ncbi:hypothetical protein [Oceanobacillus kimchii]|uniref:Uncharacterized protein n=1 Tax=Oceanobacillus kimchii TaxID=746691 RepID=A0ABQ5TJ53_9BACI|nr:hypothetical protein [Oceanobacillus kimchii]GLO66182.1 hypothetical protein MACH08_19660 [Oceanobacillus kimchii]